MSVKAFLEAARRAQPLLEQIDARVYDDEEQLRKDHADFFVDDIEHLTSPVTDLNAFSGALAFLASTDGRLLVESHDHRALRVLYAQIAHPFFTLRPRWAAVEATLDRYPGYERTVQLAEEARSLLAGSLAELLGAPPAVAPAPFLPATSPALGYGALNQLACDRHFGRHVEVGDRVLQVCSRSVNEMFIPGSAEVFWNAVQALPAMDEAFRAAGIDVGTVIRAYERRPDVPLREPAGMQLTLDNTIGFVGRRFGQRYPLTDTHRCIRATGVLRVSDLVLGALEHGFEPSTRTYAKLVKRLCAAMGLEVVDRLHPSIEAFRLDLAGKLRTAFDYFAALDPSMERQQFVLYEAGQQLALQPFGVYGGYKVLDRPARGDSAWLARGNVIQPSRAFSDESLSALADLIRKNALERDFQRFFEERPQFLLALGGDYVRAYPQLVLEEDGGSTLIPDFFLERIDSGMADILDLKTPTQALKRLQRNRNRFRAAVMEGVAQLTHYRNWFERRANRDLFRARYGLGVYRPRVVLVIGRRQDYYTDLQRIHTEAMLPDWFALRTYDDVVDAARSYRQLFRRASSPAPPR